MSKRTLEEYQDHIIAITDYQMYYSFSLNHLEHRGNPYGEYCHPRIKGELVHSPIKDTREINITILVSRIDDNILNTNINPYHQTPLGVGHIEKRKSDLRASLSIPLSGMLLINQHLLEKRLPYIAAHCKKMKYGKASIVTYHFLTEEELIDFY